MKFFDQLKIKTKLILFFLLAVIIISLASLYMYLSLKVLTNDAIALFESNLTLTDVYRNLDTLQDDLEEYISTNNSDDLLSFYDTMNKLDNYAITLKKKAPQSKQYLGLVNTSNMISNYLIEAEETIVYKRKLDVQSFSTSYTQSKKHYESIQQYIESIMSTSLIESTDRYDQIASRIRTSTYINIALTISVFGLIIFLISGFSKDVTSPLRELATFSKRIADGEYDLGVKREKSNDEIGILYDSFHSMAYSVSASIESLKDKVRLEQVLAQERLHNLEMESALKEAELSALQAQVNPHFMFNTLNIGAKIAHLQNDPVTGEYLENTASIFRYNLKGLHKPATLKEEMDNAKAYLSLLKTRFGDLIEYTIEYGEDPLALNYEIPRMTLQPLVENAYIHGISKSETGGMIKVSITSDQDYYRLVVENSGASFNSELIHMINTKKSLNIERNKSTHHGHTTGIGLNNLIQRLILHTHQSNVIYIESIEGVTYITLLLPKSISEEKAHV